MGEFFRPVCLRQWIWGLALLALTPICVWGEDPDPAGLVAWYRGDQGLPRHGIFVADWEDQAVGTDNPGQNLNLLRGRPQSVLVETPFGPAQVLRLDGDSVLSGSPKNWGTLEADRTVVVLARLHPGSQGFLFDGTTHTGMSRAQVRDGFWQTGGQPSPIANAARPDPKTLPAKAGEWQIHAFISRPQADGSMIVQHFEGDQSRAEVRVPAAVPQAGFVLGANARAEQPLAVDVAELQVYSRALSAEEFQRIVQNMRGRWGTLAELPAADQQVSPLTDPQLFRTVLKKQGDDGVHTYRIPGLATTKTGALLAVFDIRHESTRDLPANIDVGLMRSTNGGETWEPMQTILDFDKDAPGSSGNGVGDPAILADHQTGDVFVAAIWSFGERGWAKSGPGLSPEETGQLVLTRSSDDGRTWSPPINITEQVKHKDWKIFFQGPGAGIQLKDGTLVFAAQYKSTDDVPHSCILWSSDHGETWHVSAPAVPEGYNTSESQVAELSDGSLLLTMRNERRVGQRLWARYEWKNSLKDGKWSAPWLDLPDPTCMASIVRHPSGALLFANPNSSRRRIGLTVRVSDDDGQTWSEGRLIDPRFCSYSCLTVLKNGEIGLLYECGDQHAVETLTFARFSLDWARGEQTEKKPVSFQLAPVYSDNMVLPADVPIPIWGTSQPGQPIAVQFEDQHVETKADDAGTWSLQLKPIAVSTVPRTLTVTSSGTAGREEVTLSNLLVGDVWLAAGQSNMDWPVARSQEVLSQVMSADTPQIRLLRRKGPGSANIVYSPAVISRLDPDRYFAGTWEMASPTNVGQFSAVAWTTAKQLQQELQRPIGIIDVSIGGTPAEAWTPRSALAENSHLKGLVQGNWLENPEGDEWCRERATRNLSGIIASGRSVPGNDIGPYHCYQPGFLWQAGVAPLVPFPVKGVLWYQGESNATSAVRVVQHAQLFPVLVESWREAWNAPRLPFYYVQLPGIERPDWPEFRDQQRRFLQQIPDAGMAITIDLGHPTDVHPRRKEPVGKRLALLALSRAYGRACLDSGPLVIDAIAESTGCRLRFHFADGLHSRDQTELTGFELAGADGIFHPAEATLRGEEVMVTAAAVPDPREVRYGGQPHSVPPLNLVNRIEIPASPFRIRVTSSP